MTRRRKEELLGYYYPRFALFPKKIDGKWIWFSRYYRKITAKFTGGYEVTDIDVDEYLFLKLSNKLIPDHLRAYTQKE